MCFSSSLLTTERSEIGLYLYGSVELVVVIGMGTTEDIFHFCGIFAVLIERLKRPYQYPIQILN